jgi:hypothetical protein
MLTVFQSQWSLVCRLVISEILIVPRDMPKRIEEVSPSPPPSEHFVSIAVDVEEV